MVTSKIRREICKDRALCGPLEKTGRVDARPPVGIRKVLDLHSQGVVLAEGGELVPPSGVQPCGLRCVNPVVDGDRLTPKVRGGQVQ